MYILIYNIIQLWRSRHSPTLELARANPDDMIFFVNFCFLNVFSEI